MADAKQLILELRPPEYTDEEKEKITDYFIATRKDFIQSFLESKKLSRSGTKGDIRDRVIEAIDDGSLAYKDLVHFIDTYVMGSKQHVCLFDGPEAEVSSWRNKKHVEDALARNRVKKYLNARLPLILPTRMSLSSVQYDERSLKVFCVERRDFHERRAELDEHRTSKSGRHVELRAFVHQVMRGVILFYWDLMSNNATLHMTQLPSGTKYEDIEAEFFRLVGGWLNPGWFQKIDLRPVVKKLHELERSGHPETRSHAIKYMTVGGRSVMAQSATAHNSLLGEPQLDVALDNVKDVSIGHRGNFYWLPNTPGPQDGNPLNCEVHTYIEGSEGRINFSTPNRPEHIGYVLQRVRALS